eukprot:TRINITY_DN1534_c0_g1_i1.p2 TRINITY_DN1534_c0_g1~~TRINITY_DN1534_c0_g1_i1.p2  ORF type:complete len:192 (+),score=28.35 TRINITY_DN1534_c0_g1_i1:174-749(+)
MVTQVMQTTAKKGAKKPKHTHPSYESMVSEAIRTLAERMGSSSIAIAKYLTAKKDWDLPTNFSKQLSIQLKRMVADGKLKKVKASYKLGESLKAKAGSTKAKTTIAKKTGAKSAQKVVSKALSAKKPAPSKVVKKTAPKKPGAKPSAKKATQTAQAKTTGVKVTVKKAAATKKKAPSKKAAPKARKTPSKK